MWKLSFHHMTLLTLCWADCYAHWKVCPGAWNNSKKVRHALVTNSVHEDSAGQLTMLEVRADYRWVKSRVYEHNLVKRNQKILVQADDQGGLVCCGPWSCKESDTTERLNWTEQTTYSKHQDQAEWRKESWLPWRQPKSCLPAPEEEADVMVHNLQVTEQPKGPLAKMMWLSSGLMWKHVSGKSELRWFLLRNQPEFCYLCSGCACVQILVLEGLSVWPVWWIMGPFTALGKSSGLAVRDVTQIGGHPWARPDLSTQFHLSESHLSPSFSTPLSLHWASGSRPSQGHARSPKLSSCLPSLIFSFHLSRITFSRLHLAS